MDTRAAYDDRMVASASSDQLIDPRSLSRRKRRQNDRLWGAGVVSAVVSLGIRRLGLAGLNRLHRGRRRPAGNAPRQGPWLLPPTVTSRGRLLFGFRPQVAGPVGHAPLAGERKRR